MFISIIGNLHNMETLTLQDATKDFPAIFHSSTLVMFTLDLLTTIAGYSLTLRLFDTHIRSSEPTLFGWVICIMCYQPFLSLFMQQYFSYLGSDDNWMHWLQDEPAIQMIWGGFVLIALIIYTFASLHFGCRFSNLTHRGILTSGVYRFTKHPAYVSKNFMWWLMFVPFFWPDGWWGNRPLVHAARRHQRRLLPARPHRRKSPLPRPRLRRICIMDERPRHLPPRR